jgi:hypothetical protein
MFATLYPDTQQLDCQHRKTYFHVLDSHYKHSHQQSHNADPTQLEVATQSLQAARIA